LRMITALCIALALTAGAADPQARPKADPEEIKLVDYFVSSDLSELPPEYVEDFMAVDPEGLPPQLRLRYRARRLELQTLKQLTQGGKKGMIRTPKADCSIPDEAKSGDASTLRQASFSEISETEERFLIDKTQCSERDLMCEFSLQVVVEREPKTRKVKRTRYFLYTSDPLNALVAAFRSKNGASDTNFFGKASPLCAR
jgi:hypothetical protein